MTCMTCEEMDNKEKIVYEDDICFAILGHGAIGHVIISPKKHVKKLEELEKEAVDHIFTVASYAATVVFESLGAQGTNIICNSNKNNGHLMVDVIPRSFSDDLDFQWEPRKIPEDEMQNVASRIKEKTFFIGKEKPKDESVEIKSADKLDSESYKEQLRRLP